MTSTTTPPPPSQDSSSIIIIKPREGLFASQLDSFVGPGATTAELVLQFGASLLIGLGCMLVYQETNPHATAWQNTIVALIGMDMIGGVVTNSTNAAKRWYHRPSQGFVQHMTFIAIHALQIATVAYQFVVVSEDEEEEHQQHQKQQLLYFALVYGTLLIFSTIVLTVPLYLQRPVAMALVAAIIPASMSRQLVPIPQTPGLGWFLPLLFLKLLVSHLTNETPFRPQPQHNNDAAATTTKAKNL